LQPHRILVVHSFADAGMAGRIRQAETNPVLKDIEFRHIAVMDPARGSPRITRLDSLYDQYKLVSTRNRTEIRRLTDEITREVIRDEVKPLLLANVDEFHPDLLLIHGGTIFNAATGPILQVLIDIREHYPNLPYALEGKSEWLIRASGRDYSAFERSTAANQIRWVRHNFVNDPNIDTIIDELF
jgi:hypothetical protein